MKEAKKIWQQVSEKIDKWDILLLLIIVLGYGIFSFINLGTTQSPQTFYTFDQNQNEIVIELSKQPSYVTTLRYFVGEIPGKYKIYTSMDNQEYQLLTTEEEKYVFSWNDISILENTRYIKIEGLDEKSQIGEIQLYQNEHKLASHVMEQHMNVVMDEKDTVPKEISYMNSTYFDEIYFARTAYEYANHLSAYEWVHPPLGKLIQAIPIYFFGMSPFTYRMMGNISGILLIVVMYCFAKNIFHCRKYALLAACLMMFDNFHFAQSRMGTIDTHLVLFILLSYWMMYRYIQLKEDQPWKKKMVPLGLCGLFISCAIATKWTGLFAGLGLAILFFLHFYQTYLKKGKKWTKEATKTILFCICVFVALPITIYISCYLLFPNVSIYQVDSIQSLIDVTGYMFSYHNDLTDTHPFSSMWYTWPVMLKPVWYYFMEVGNQVQTISGIGNPIVWWTGVIAFFYYLIPRKRKKTKEMTFCIIAISCMFFSYLPITRAMFLYHYFPVLPFVMLLVIWLIYDITENQKNRIIFPVFLILVIILFLYFYPVSSGMSTTQSMIDIRKWFSTWIF